LKSFNIPFKTQLREEKGPSKLLMKTVLKKAALTSWKIKYIIRLSRMSTSFA